MKFTLERRDDSFSKHLAEIIRQRCVLNGLKYDPEDPQLIICIGGDGTILRAIHKWMDALDRVYFVGIHTGTLGFFTDYTKDEINSFIHDLKNGPVSIDEATLLEMYLPERKETHLALNEVKIEGYTKTLSVDVYIDGEFFEKCTGSGICISTQSGSTAINRALNGAVIDLGVDVLQLTEIMPICHKGHHSLRNPYIMNTSRKIELYGHSLSEAIASYDHLETQLKGINRIVIKAAQKKVRFIRYRTYSYLTRLKSLY